MIIQTIGLATAAVVLLVAVYLLGTTIRERRRTRQILEQTVAEARESIEARRSELERERQKTELSWDGHRKFEVAKKVVESDDERICSFYLVPHDSRPLPPFEPGQFLTFQLRVPTGDGSRESVVRCYSLSDGPTPEYYRISVKRLLPPPDEPDAPPGVASNHFHDDVEEDDILDVRAPGGDFFLDREHERPVVLIGGGVGVTPMVSMLNTIYESGSRREAWFFYGIHDSTEEMARERLDEIARGRDNIHVRICHSRPLDEDVEGEDYDHEGRVTVELFKELLPSNNYEYYVCGPPPMMSAIFEDLREWGVPEEDIKYEAFGPATVKKTQKEGGEAVEHEVSFARTGETCTWSGGGMTLLELAEDHGVPIDFGCRVGNCNTCLTAVKDGDVEYVHEPDTMPEEGSCLTCISIPDGDLVLDA